jgi:tetratricopeptide (TPR) repeat protein
VKPGNTGSPVLNMDGDVIGATVISSKKGRNMHQAALLDMLLKQLELYKKSAELKKNVRMPYQPKKEAKPTVTADEYFLLGCNYTTSRSYKEAIEAYKESLRKNPNFTDAYLNLGVVYYKIGKYPEAIDAFKKATLSSPESLSAYHKLGTTYIIRGAYSDAIEVFQKAITIDPDNSEAHFNLGIAYFLSGDRTAAFGEYITLKNIDKERADLLREILVN